MQEINHATLKAALRQLPTYAPPSVAWERIEAGLSDIASNVTQKDVRLHEAIQQLPTYVPPTLVWEGIEATLDDVQADLPSFQHQIKALPTYSPPTSLWYGIEQELDQPSEHTVALKPIFTLKTWQKYAIAALFLGCLLTFGVVFYQNATSVGNEKITVAYSEEKYDTTPIKEDWDDDEAAFAKVEAICQQQAFICEQPEVKTLKSELDELNEAKQSLKNALGQYGTDETVVAELVAVEKERSEVLKKIMQKI
jgi:hypothetical protein